MSDKSRPVMFARQAAELDYALDRNNCGPDFVRWLSTGNILASIRDVYLDIAEIKAIEHVIDCNADPFLPYEWKVEKHEKSGFFKWNPKAVRLYRHKLQGGKYFFGNKLREELDGKLTLNANVLDYLFAHPRLIPESWKEQTNGYTTYVFFWGTIYISPGGNLYVRSLSWIGGGWRCGHGWLGGDWRDNCLAVMRAPVENPGPRGPLYVES